MREIKFRAWSKTHGEFWYYEMFHGQLGWNKFYGDGLDGLQPWQQYTGLKDKNGVEIYEGDIVGYRDGEWSFDAVVEWSDHSWFMRGIEPVDNFNFDDTSPGELEVIGNIYENPELLAGGSNG